MKSVNPYLNFHGNTEEAFEFYKNVFGGEFLVVIRFKDMPGMPDLDKMSEDDQNKIMHVALPIASGVIMMGSDVPETMERSRKAGNNIYINLEAGSGEEAEQLFNGLADGGTVEMALQKTTWSEKFGQCIDKFGVQWMVNYTGTVQMDWLR